MSVKIARANVIPKRQPSQYSCVTTSLSIALQALGIPETECYTAKVNEVLGAQPLQGASWEQAAGAASHYGCRTTLVIPSTLSQVRKWTDAGIPVLIGWNTGNEWSHASLIFDVDDQNVFICDPNIPNPDTLVRIMDHNSFYEKWWEKSSVGYKIRRPAMAVEREITESGRQVMASIKVAELPKVDSLRATWSYNDPELYREYNIYEDDTKDPIGVIQWTMTDNAWKVYQDPDNMIRLGIFTAKDERDGVKRSLMLFKAHRKQGTTMTLSEMAVRVAVAHEAAKNKPVTIKKEDLPKNRMGPEIVQMYNRKTRFDDPGADYARGHGRKPKHPNKDEE